MRLKKLELMGFKSFAQRTEIVFQGGITGIVGPNGSGKSNIGDAVRWVLGEQSAKTLRGASMADVIFGGTQKRKPLSYCEVSLVFDNEDRALPMDFAEIMVTRRVYRSGESEYYLNRAACRLKDVVDLFRDTGIGREGYSIIGQGRIDEILSRKSEDRRQVFEEAAGIVKFKARKEEADKKLQRTLENAARVDDILEELKRQIGPLEKQSKAARQYLELSGQLKELDLNLFLIRSDRAKARLNELDTELMGLNAALHDTEAALAQKTEERDAHQAKIAELEEKITGARAGLMVCAETVSSVQSALSAVEGRMEARRENRARLLKEQDAAREKLAQLAQAQAQKQTELEAQDALIGTAEKALEEAQRDSESAREEALKAEQALEIHKEQLLNAMNQLSQLRNDQTRLKTMRAQMAERLTEVNASEQAMAEEEARLEAARNEALGRKAEEEARLKALQNALEDAQEQLRQASAASAAHRAEAEKLQATLQATQSRWKLLSEMTREMEGYSQSVRRAVQYAKDREIPGVRGVLAQLISVPAKYETAIDMALGAAQQNIVTDTEEAAKQLIDYLRQNRLGRATFLPRSAIRSKMLNDREKQALSLPGCLGVASELVQCAGEYRAIVENLLGRTVIADNLEHGIAIMRAGSHAFRLVTLEGDVMHSGGSMTGGSIQSKMVNLLSREREVKELDAQLRDGRVRFMSAKALLEADAKEGQALRSKAEEALESVHQQEIAVARETERVSRAQDEKNAHAERLAQTRQAQVQLTESIEQLDAQLQSVSTTDSVQQLDQSAMEKKTEALQAAVQDARARSQASADRLMHRTLQLSDLRHTRDLMARDEQRAQDDASAIRAAEDERARTLEQMDAQEQSDAQDRARLTQQTQVEQDAMRRQEIVAQGLESRRSDSQAKLKNVLEDMEHLHETKTRDADSLHQAEMRRAKVDGDLRALQDRIWNTYEVTYAGAEPFRQENVNVTEAERQVASLNGKIRALGTVNVNAVEEYAATKERFDELILQQQDLRRAEEDLRELIDRLMQQMRVTFVDSFEKLQVYFSETFVRLFGGGHAELKLTDPNDPLNCGIEVNAQPPGKKLQLLSLLSGGERALCAIAILFAMLKLKPTPFCILDEIEAALDDANIGYYADYLKEYSQDTQFIVVTHRKGTMERCDALYGVAMEEQGVSKMVSVSLIEAANAS